MGTRDKKWIQSILIIALLLLLYGYYSIHQSVESSGGKNFEQKIDDFHHDFGNITHDNDIFFNDFIH